MDNSIIIQLYNNINDKLLNSNFIKEIPVPIQFIKDHLEDPNFIKKIRKMVEDDDYSCGAILDICQDMLNELSREEAPENWLDYIYYFTLSKSFPDTVSIDLKESLRGPCLIYLNILRIVCEFEKLYSIKKWQSKYPLRFLSKKEELRLEDSTEYRAFRRAFKEEYIYEMMKLNQEVMGYSTLHHICGVHYLAMHIGRQLKKLGLPIDLGRVSGAAAGHDIGKFGCKPSEANRVAYLHYYYTDMWFKKHDITYIRNVAINHSTWDLELENLPLESLVLIYSDFRVKKKDKSTGSKLSDMYIYTLKESFDIVLNKLDNVDIAKEKRYMRVYSKLKDFENYMADLGVETELDKENTGIKEQPKKYFSLMQGNEIIDNIKYYSISQNINLMYRLRDEASLNLILEHARSEKNLNNIRQYLNVIEEYSTYLTQKQKLITLSFLYEELLHPDEDIRKKCSELIGALIAIFDEVYRKEIPENTEVEVPELTGVGLFKKYLKLFISPSKKIIKLHQVWINNCLTTMIRSTIENCRENKKQEYINLLLDNYRQYNYNIVVKQNLLYSLRYVTLSDCNDENIKLVINYIINMLQDENIEIRLEAFEVIYKIAFQLKSKHEYINILKNRMADLVDYSSVPAENYLKLKIAKILNMDKYIVNRFQFYCREDSNKISNIFLSNLKTGTDWVVKKIQVDLLVEHTLSNLDDTGIHTAMHFCNLLKVSSNESVRNRGGEALIKIIQYLSFDERNDIAVELIRSLEIEGYQFTKYIPKYLGQILLHLHPVELDELVDDLIEKIKQSSFRVITLLLETIGIIMEHYPLYKDKFNEEETEYNARRVRLLGTILNGLVHYDHNVKQVALNVIGRNIFGSKLLSLDQQKEIFKLMAKKVLTLGAEYKTDKELLFLSNAALFNYIYRFISNYKFYRGNIELDINEKVAFFPGSFDPFSSSHKEIVREIKKLGFEVYLSIDEFSWSKRTQPNIIRREIVKMSISNELGIYLFPRDLQTNIANAQDLKRLKSDFPQSEVYIVAGSDVLLNASAYRIESNYIKTFSHIVFERRNSYKTNDDKIRLNEIADSIDGEVIRLTLPLEYEHISSTQIRNYIDESRDISKLVDPLAQKYIFDNSLYRREPQYKTLVQTKSINVEIIDEFSPEILRELSSIFDLDRDTIYDILVEFSEKLNPKALLIRDINNNGTILGFTIFHWIRSGMMYKEFIDSTATEYIRKNYVGRIIVIDGVFINNNYYFENLEQILLTETLTYNLERDYTYGIFRNIIKGYKTDTLKETLTLQGFLEVPCDRKDNDIFAVNMTSPCTLKLDIETIIKEPFIGNHNIEQSIIRTRKRLQKAIVDLYPGHLLISFDRNMMYENLIKRICETNEVSTIPTNPRQLGEKICVPFGDLLNGCIIPNTITKTLHTEKIFSKSVKNYRIGSYPNYLSLPNQVKMIKSFNRQVILVDDLLHKGYRIKTLDPLLKKENIDVQKIIVGILSGRGKELMDIQNREVDSAYFIPNLRVWFSESFMYPFIEGHVLWREVYPQRNLVSSINLILPYTSPGFIKGTSNEAIYNLSKVSIENAIDILSTLENEYSNVNERNLTLSHLAEVFVSPKCPEHGENMYYDYNIGSSHYLRNDLEHLKRLQEIICG